MKMMAWADGTVKQAPMNLPSPLCWASFRMHLFCSDTAIFPRFSLSSEYVRWWNKWKWNIQEEVEGSSRSNREPDELIV